MGKLWEDPQFFNDHLRACFKEVFCARDKDIGIFGVLLVLSLEKIQHSFCA